MHEQKKSVIQRGLFAAVVFLLFATTLAIAESDTKLSKGETVYVSTYSMPLFLFCCLYTFMERKKSSPLHWPWDSPLWYAPPMYCFAWFFCRCC